MLYLIACKTYLINADWTVACELTSYISFASILYLCALFFNFRVWICSEARNYTINGSISKILLNLNDVNITFMKYNWLKPISFTSIFEFEVDPYMELLLIVTIAGSPVCKVRFWSRKYLPNRYSISIPHKTMYGIYLYGMSHPMIMSSIYKPALWSLKSVLFSRAVMYASCFFHLLIRSSLLSLSRSESFNRTFE